MTDAWTVEEPVLASWTLITPSNPTPPPEGDTGGIDLTNDLSTDGLADH